jgi:hypothetical protein
VVLAQEESRLLDHNYIGTEHLLLGLIHEGEGVAAHVLTGMGISLDTVRVEVEAIIGSGGQARSGSIPFTPRAKQVLELSLREALQLGHNYIGTEHILLGMIREGEGVAAQVLVKLGADLSRVRQAVIEVLGGHEGAHVHVEQPGPEPRPRRRTTIRPARCGFCNTPSPECGALYSGSSGALICGSCAAAARPSLLSPMQPPSPSEAAGLRSRIQGMVERTLRFEHNEPVEELAARIEPTGPPPEDEEAALQAIFVAFQNSMEVGADGRTLINVEDGAALADCAEQVRIRSASIAPQVSQTIDRIKFLDATTAVVWLTTLLNGRPPHPGLFRRECRAVLVDGRWKVSRESMCASWAFGGVHCPPLVRDQGPTTP